ncbi:MAG: endonuclease domain-containing protein [Streptomycetales bacterium]
MAAPRGIPAALLTRPFRLADAHALGVTHSQLRGRRFRRLFHDVYVAAALPDTLELRCEATRLVLPPAAIFTHRACEPHGAPQVRHASARVIRAARAAPLAARPEAHGTGPHLPRSGGDPPTPDLVVLGDAMLHSGLASRQDLLGAVQYATRRRGVRRARRAILLLHPGAESPMETRLRLVLAAGGLPPPEVNADVRDDWGHWIARVDLLYRDARVVVEYEGDHHRTDRRQFANDLRRGDLLAEHGYLVLRFTAAQVYREPHRVVAAVRNAMLRTQQSQPAC